MWLTNEDYATFGQTLQKPISPYPMNSVDTSVKKHRPGKDEPAFGEISDFYRHFIGLSKAPENLAEWIRIPESFLAKATNGQVFTDPLGQFSTIRHSLLTFYPEDIRIKKIAYYACQMPKAVNIIINAA